MIKLQIETVTEFRVGQWSWELGEERRYRVALEFRNCDLLKGRRIVMEISAMPLGTFTQLKVKIIGVLDTA